jgi:hypothetical protein
VPRGGGALLPSPPIAALPADHRRRRRRRRRGGRRPAQLLRCAKDAKLRKFSLKYHLRVISIPTAILT